MDTIWINHVLFGVFCLFVLFFCYLLLGGRAIFGTHEHAKRILGKWVQLYDLESGPKGCDPDQPTLPPAKVDSYSPETGYRLVFETPIKWLERIEDCAYVGARSVGYPVSLLAVPWRRNIVVQGYFRSGEQFIGFVRLYKGHLAPSNNAFEGRLPSAADQRGR